MGRAHGYEPRYPGLTRRQQDIISFFTDHARHNDYPPTLREIGMVKLPTRRRQARRADS